jgi:hypothetical protein
MPVPDASALSKEKNKNTKNNSLLIGMESAMFEARSEKSVIATTIKARQSDK